MRPALVIGLGTSGMQILEQLEQFMYAAYGTNMLTRAANDGVVLLNIETDEGRKPRKTPVGTLISGPYDIKATVADIQNAWDRLKAENCDLAWFDPKVGEKFKKNGIKDGAGHYRAAGRLAFWHIDNFNNIRATIKGALDLISPHGRPSVIVTGTLIGGTCSGMFIDLAYLVREIFKKNAEYIGLFLVPESGLGDDSHRHYCNCLASLEDLDYFNTTGHSYKYKWPNGVQAAFGTDLPFDFSYLVSTQYEPTSNLHNLKKVDDLYYLGGYFLFSYLCGLQTPIYTEHSNRQGGTPIVSFGLSGVTYPLYAFSELLGCILAKELLDNLLDEHYTTSISGERVPLEEGTAEKKAEAFLDDEVLKIISKLEALGDDQALSDIIKEQTKRWQDKEIDPKDIKGIFQLDPAKPANTRALMEGKETHIRDTLVNSVDEELSKQLKNAENLVYLKKFMEGLSAYRQQLGKLWKKQVGLESQKSLEDDITKTSLQMLGILEMDRNLGNQEHIWQLADKVRIYLVNKVLKEVDFKENDEVILTYSNITEIISGITESHGGGRQKITERQAHLANLFQDESLPIKNIWIKKDLKTDRDYFLRKIRPISFRKINWGEDLPRLLLRFKPDPHEKENPVWAALVGDCQRLVFAQLQSELNNQTMDALVKNNNITIDTVADKARFILLPMEIGGFRFGKDGVPSIMAHANTGTLQSLRAGIPQGFTRFCVVPEFPYTVVFYQEQLNLKPIDDLVHRKEMAKYRVEPEPAYTPREWEMMSDPYQVVQKKLWPRAQKVARVLQNLVIKWETDPHSGALRPGGSNLDRLEVRREGSKVHLTYGGDSVEAVYVPLDSFIESLTRELAGHRLFLEQTLAALKAWEPDAISGILPYQSQRWPKMGYSEEGIADLNYQYRILAAHLAD